MNGGIVTILIYCYVVAANDFISNKCLCNSKQFILGKDSKHNLPMYGILIVCKRNCATETGETQSNCVTCQLHFAFCQKPWPPLSASLQSRENV